MAATTDQLIALANDAQFRQRVRQLMLQICSQIFNEDPATLNHNSRVAYAFKVVANPSLAEQMAVVLCTRTNVVASVVSVDFTHGSVAVVTDASDAALLSQIATDWNLFAGVA